VNRPPRQRARAIAAIPCYPCVDPVGCLRAFLDANSTRSRVVDRPPNSLIPFGLRVPVFRFRPIRFSVTFFGASPVGAACACARTSCPANWRTLFAKNLYACTVAYSAGGSPVVCACVSVVFAATTATIVLYPSCGRYALRVQVRLK